MTGEVGVSLADDTWFDPAGNVMKQRNPEDAGFEKIAYDAATRVTHRYAGYNNVTPPNYGEAGSVAEDTIFEQTDYTYDGAAVVIQEASHERFHNTSGVGPLLGPTGDAPNARVLYQMYFVDGLQRVIATANYGTNGGTPPERPETVPERSDTVLVSTTDYNARGEVAAVADPNATITFQVYDDAGRLIETIENYQPIAEE